MKIRNTRTVLVNTQELQVQGWAPQFTVQGVKTVGVLLSAPLPPPLPRPPIWMTGGVCADRSWVIDPYKMVARVPTLGRAPTATPTPEPRRSG
jgi:hypothetical protein